MGISIEERLREVVSLLHFNVEIEVTTTGYIPSKHERIVKTFYNVAWGTLSKAEWKRELQKWIKILQQYDFDKVAYKTATKKGSSRLYLIKYSS